MRATVLKINIISNNFYWKIEMNINIIQQADSLWLPVADYAETCSWDACARMAASMRNGNFKDWERIFIANENGDFMGFCALIKYESEYNPLLKWLFINEKYRGHRLSQKLIEEASVYAKSIGFNQVYLTTWHTGLYEKYGFEKICDKEMRNGYFEGVYEKKI